MAVAPTDPLAYERVLETLYPNDKLFRPGVSSTGCALRDAESTARLWSPNTSLPPRIEPPTGSPPAGNGQQTNRSRPSYRLGHSSLCRRPESV